VICIGGIYGVWQVRGAIGSSLDNTFTMLSDTLGATGDALVLANDSLDAASTSVGTLAETITTTGESVQDILPLFDTISNLTSVELPDTIEATQSALRSAQESAVVIDSTLMVLTAIPLLPVPAYDPSMSLGDSLGQVVTSLDPLPDSLSSIEGTLETTKVNIGKVEGQFSTIAENITQISGSLTQTKDVITQYKTVVDTLQKQVDGITGNLGQYLNIAAWVFSVMLGWLALTQVGLLFQGLEMVGLELIQDKDEEKEEPKEPEMKEETELAGSEPETSKEEKE